MTIYPRLSLLFICIIMFSCDQFNSTKNNTSNTKVIDNPNKQIALLDNQFLIKGSSFSDALTTVYLHQYENKIHKIIDSVAITDKTFSFKGVITTPKEYFLSSNLSNKRFKLLIDSSTINVFLAENIENSSTFSSTKIQKEYKAYNQKMLEFRTKGVALYYNLKGNFSSKNIEKLKKDRSKLFSDQGSYTFDFIKTHPNSYYAAMLIDQNLDIYPNTKLRTLFNGLTDNLKSLTEVKLVDSAISAKEAFVDTKLPVVVVKPTETKSYEEYRPKAYSLSGKNPYGETMSLNSIPRGKVVLLDFWASWCGPCRASNPNLVALYNKYNADGFEIMSVSEDKGEAEWMTAINVDNLNWNYHVLDKNKSIAFRYGVESIPFKLLIDKKGRIASEKISGRKLEQRIKELLEE